MNLNDPPLDQPDNPRRQPNEPANLQLERMNLAEPAIAGLAAPFTARARAYLTLLASGKSSNQALRRTGLHAQSVADWKRGDPAFAEAVEMAKLLGAGYFEDELTRRAMAGSDDRGSMRALELVMKQRDPSYRESKGNSVNVYVDQREARERRVQGWQGAEPIEGESTTLEKSND